MAEAGLDFLLMVLAIMVGLVAGKFIKIGIARTGLVPISAGNALSQNPAAILARTGGQI